jgi:TetR/AcrR family transcriptional regulator, mexJK operon transcriptional repressor
VSAEVGRRRAGRLASGGAIREAAARLFLEKGYQGTSMDDVAAAAQVSKQTIYTHFENKERLFADLVLGNAETVDAFVATLAPALEAPGDLGPGLRELARRYLHIVMRPEVLRLRRLVLGEAGRFPELARTYYERVPGRVIAELTAIFARLTEAGRLNAERPDVAAQQFAWLTLGLALDRAMFEPIEEIAPNGNLDGIADAAVETFLAAYAAR